VKYELKKLESLTSVEPGSEPIVEERVISVISPNDLDDIREYQE
jgi:hypothetical protein